MKGSMCAACGQPGHRFGFNEGPDRFDPTACINGLLYDLDAARRAHRVAVRALSQALGERDHYRAWIETMLADDYLWREGQGEVGFRTNVRLTLSGALGVAGDDSKPWRNNDCPHGYGFDDCCHDPSECVAGDDPCGHDSIDTFASGAGRRVDVCMGCKRVEFWNVSDPVPYRALEGSEGGEDDR